MTLLADSVNVRILRLLADGPLESGELGRRLENVSRASRFKHLAQLEELRVVAVDKRGAPPLTRYRLTAAAARLREVERTLERWLARAPDKRPPRLDEATASEPIKALAHAWDAQVLRWSAQEPRSLTELETESPPSITSHDLRRARDALLAAGLIERGGDEGRHRRYSVTRWARESVAPLAVAVRWERRDIPDLGAAVTALDVEAGLLLTLPLLELPAARAGSCALLVDADEDVTLLGGLALRVEDGRVVEYRPCAEPEGMGWARAGVASWLEAVIEARLDLLDRDADGGLARDLVSALHEALFER